ncbi:Prkg1, partial [Symbiodinium pilosum]
MVTDVNCRLARDICSLFNVTEFPAIMYGSPYGLQQYDKPLSELSSFAEALSETCSPERPDLCSERLQKQLEVLSGSSLEDLKSQLEENKARQQDLIS